MKKIRVVHINTPYQIVLDCGAEDGVKVGDYFLVFGEGPVISNMDGDELESLEIVRGKGKVTHLQRRICTIDSILTEERPKTIKKTRNNNSLFGSLNSGETEETEIIRERVEFDEVQIGDYARKY